jgi:hypothetical protein
VRCVSGPRGEDGVRCARTNCSDDVSTSAPKQSDAALLILASDSFSVKAAATAPYNTQADGEHSKAMACHARTDVRGIAKAAAARGNLGERNAAA